MTRPKHADTDDLPMEPTMGNYDSRLGKYGYIMVQHSFKQLRVDRQWWQTMGAETDRDRVGLDGAVDGMDGLAHVACNARSLIADNSH